MSGITELIVPNHVSVNLGEHVTDQVVSVTVRQERKDHFVKVTVLSDFTETIVNIYVRAITGQFATRWMGYVIALLDSWAIIASAPAIMDFTVPTVKKSVVARMMDFAIPSTDHVLVHLDFRVDTVT